VRSFRLIILAQIILFLVLSGCSDPENDHNYYAVPGPVGDLYRFCYESGEDSDFYEFEVLLYLDWVNVPNPDYSHPWLTLNGTNRAGSAFWENVAFEYYEFEDIPEDSGFPETPENGWKVHITGARVNYCTTCLTNDGLLKKISLSGPKELVEFIWDPGDTLEIFTQPVPIE